MRNWEGSEKKNGCVIFGEFEVTVTQAIIQLVIG